MFKICLILFWAFLTLFVWPSESEWLEQVSEVVNSSSVTWNWSAWVLCAGLKSPVKHSWAGRPGANVELLPHRCKQKNGGNWQISGVSCVPGRLHGSCDTAMWAQLLSQLHPDCVGNGRLKRGSSLLSGVSGALLFRPNTRGKHQPSGESKGHQRWHDGTRRNENGSTKQGMQIPIHQLWPLHRDSISGH